jgi:hypothetical protein
MRISRWPSGYMCTRRRRTWSRVATHSTLCSEPDSGERVRFCEIRGRFGACGTARGSQNPGVSWSGWRDSNPRPLAPKASALPSCATPRPPSDQCTADTAGGVRRRLGDRTGRYDIGAPGQDPDRGRSSVAESQSSKLITRVRFPSPALPEVLPRARPTIAASKANRDRPTPCRCYGTGSVGDRHR